MVRAVSDDRLPMHTRGNAAHCDVWLQEVSPRLANIVCTLYSQSEHLMIAERDVNGNLQSPIGLASMNNNVFTETNSAYEQSPDVDY